MMAPLTFGTGMGSSSSSPPPRSVQGQEGPLYVAEIRTHKILGTYATEESCKEVQHEQWEL